MARKTVTYTADDGRDQGKVFVLTEMPASQAERWALRAFMALAKGGIELPDNVANMGMAGIAMLGVSALSRTPWPEAQPLLDEMFGCVQIRPNPKSPAVVRELVEDDIEEIATRLKLRMELLKLHVDFSRPAAP
ncbi:MAG: hypothetical protein LBH31_09455 [Burkholderiaceae bacterium]|jgi:hypothetical protein|nr:hypothetical protein [Burkholderiaceae bacterium]